MLETSKDLFWIVLSFCILWFTIFICWGIYYIIMVFKNINDLVREIKAKIIMLEDFVSGLKNKVERSTANIATLINLGKEVVPYFKEKINKRSTKQSKTKK